MYKLCLVVVTTSKSDLIHNQTQYIYLTSPCVCRSEVHWRISWSVFSVWRNLLIIFTVYLRTPLRSVQEVLRKKREKPFRSNSMNSPEQEEVLQEHKELPEEAFWCGERLWASLSISEHPPSSDRVPASSSMTSSHLNVMKQIFIFIFVWFLNVSTDTQTTVDVTCRVSAAPPAGQTVFQPLHPIIRLMSPSSGCLASLQHSSGSILIIFIIFIIFPSISFSPQIFSRFPLGSDLLRLSDSRVFVFICTNKSRQIKTCVKNRLKQSSSPFCCWFC